MPDIESIADSIARALPTRDVAMASTQYAGEPVHEVSLSTTYPDGTSVRIVITKE